MIKLVFIAFITLIVISIVTTRHKQLIESSTICSNKTCDNGNAKSAICCGIGYYPVCRCILTGIRTSSSSTRFVCSSIMVDQKEDSTCHCVKI